MCQKKNAKMCTRITTSVRICFALVTKVDAELTRAKAIPEARCYAKKTADGPFSVSPVLVKDADRNTEFTPKYQIIPNGFNLSYPESFKLHLSQFL